MKIIRKLKSKGGESFVEILISILIVAFGCLLIATMYSSAMNMNIQASKKDDDYYKAVSEMEQMFDKDTAKSGKAYITDNKTSEGVGIDIYGNDDNAAYKR